MPSTQGRSKDADWNVGYAVAPAQKPTNTKRRPGFASLAAAALIGGGVSFLLSSGAASRYHIPLLSPQAQATTATASLGQFTANLGSPDAFLQVSVDVTGTQEQIARIQANRVAVRSTILSELTSLTPGETMGGRAAAKVAGYVQEALRNAGFPVDKVYLTQFLVIYQ
jgi:flagellar basal body-associated protein FliL